ncbi:hypothetical protein V512_014855 [Mesotoga sp. Brook.08.105.5.1]|nr:hypothetical protein V512_014855 [Mesotoga sp. Brook.08.105.5.1]RAO96465.1 hypothetical protein M388_14320 [Mesotoga sp. Brook.08.YT.4.2.5.4.]
MIFALTKNLDAKRRNEEPRREAQSMIFALNQEHGRVASERRTWARSADYDLCFNQEHGREASERGT